MPYIERWKRGSLGWALEYIISEVRGKGDLNYVITRLLCLSMKTGVSYTTLSDTRAVLLDVYDEFTRKVMVPYEDQKERENGSVHDINGYVPPIHPLDIV